MLIGIDPLPRDIVGTDPAPSFPIPAKGSDTPGAETALFGDKGFSFASLLDIINPLQHLPIVSSIYRAVTGETIAAAPRLLGGALFGGVFGFVSAALNTIIEGETGKDIGGHVIAALAGEGGPAPERPILLAQAGLASAAYRRAADPEPYGRQVDLSR
jgi:hypothetical protein